jgi:hypothetical protein
MTSGGTEDRTGKRRGVEYGVCLGLDDKQWLYEVVDGEQVGIGPVADVFDQLAEWRRRAEQAEAAAAPTEPIYCPACERVHGWPVAGSPTTEPKEGDDG